jgi:signal-transduction protein with cAMP-binding, CBS, and nucleotidyltransferase domain
MIGKALKNIFDPFIELDIQVWENFGELGEVVDFPKETILKESHTTENYLHILIDGCGGNLIWNKNNFVCIDISFKNDFLFDYMSFTLQRPTPIEVRLFEDSTVFRIPYRQFQQTMNHGNFGEKVTRLVAEASFINKQQQQIDLLTKTAKERYMQLINDKKGIDTISLKYVASYLGITPQSLSRIRAEKI